MNRARMLSTLALLLISPLLPVASARASGLLAVTLPWEGQATGRVREFTLTASRIRWEVAPGRVADAYAYNGQIPGPELRVAEGDTVRVTVVNRLDQPTTVHWHGID